MAATCYEWKQQQVTIIRLYMCTHSRDPIWPCLFRLAFVSLIWATMCARTAQLKFANRSSGLFNQSPEKDRLHEFLMIVVMTNFTIARCGYSASIPEMYMRQSQGKIFTVLAKQSNPRSNSYTNYLFQFGQDERGASYNANEVL